ncbi:MAG: T9SS type A sorting domain-containing protein [Chitinophagales bacterium]|nr:T9SS type A sorting domain-containing protein [Chitinophagales bacterium]
MKTFLLSILFLSALELSAQSTWIERLAHSGDPAGYYIFHDSVCGVLNSDVCADGNLLLLGKTHQDAEWRVWKISPSGGSFLLNIFIANHGTLSEDVPGSLRATADSGFILFINHNSWANSVSTDARIQKYSKTGVLQWTVNFKWSIINYYRPAYDLIQSASGIYYVFIRDSIFQIDNAGIVISGSGNVGGKQLIELTGGDLLVRDDTFIYRTDLAGNIAWTYSPINIMDVVSLSTDAAFVCGQGTQVTKIDILTGNALWTQTISSSPVSSIDATMDGGVIIASGLKLRASTNTAMDGALTKLDASGNQQWNKLYPLTHYGLSYVKQLPSQDYLTGGTYTAVKLTVCEDDYNGFSAVVDSAGFGLLETAENYWPGDVDLNYLLDFATDGLLVGIAYGATGPARDHKNFPTYVSTWSSYVNDYGSDWSQSYLNGINYKHADFSGDGIIDGTDLNYWIGFEPWPINCKQSGTEQINSLPDFKLIPESPTVAPGDTMRFYIVAGSSVTPVDSLYGIASVLTLNPALLSNTFKNVSAFTSGLGTPGTDLLSYSNNNLLFNAGKISMLFCRNDKNNIVQLNDTIGVIELKANSNITLPTAFDLTISQFAGMTYNTSLVDFNVLSASVLIDPGYTVVENVNREMELYPNPVSRILNVKSFDEGIKTFTIADATGKQLKYFESSASLLHIPIDDLENGTYRLIVSSNGNQKISGFVVQH